jgi:hypothetical protein
MKLIILVLLMAAQCHGGWFNDDDQQRMAQYEQTIQSERQSTGDWQIIAGVLAIGGVILFTMGTALGSKTRRDGKR